WRAGTAPTACPPSPAPGRPDPGVRSRTHHRSPSPPPSGPDVRYVQAPNVGPLGGRVVEPDARARPSRIGARLVGPDARPVGSARRVARRSRRTDPGWTADAAGPRWTP